MAESRAGQISLNAVSALPPLMLRLVELTPENAGADFAGLWPELFVAGSPRAHMPKSENPA